LDDVPKGYFRHAVALTLIAEKKQLPSPSIGLKSAPSSNLEPNFLLCQLELSVSHL
jgi:hypothetical protein